jgi:hypothetical protein
MSRPVNRFGCLALFLMAFPSMAAAVHVQDVEWPTADDYQASIANAHRQRIAQANALPISNVDSGPQLFLVSFAKRVDAGAMLAEAESYGLTVKEIHLSVGETKNAFTIAPTAPASEQIAQLQTDLLGEVSARASELKQKISGAQGVNGKPRSQQIHWWKEELKAIDAFRYSYANLPLVANGVEVAGSPPSVDRFVSSTRIPVLAVEFSSVGIKQFAIPLDVYHAYREGE